MNEIIPLDSIVGLSDSQLKKLVAAAEDAEREFRTFSKNAKLSDAYIGENIYPEGASFILEVYRNNPN